MVLVMANRDRIRKLEEETAKTNQHMRTVLKNIADRERVASIVNPLVIGQGLATEFFQDVINPPETFNRSLKTQDRDKIRLAYAIHMFTRYAVPKRVQSIWYFKQQQEAANGGRLRANRKFIPGEMRFKDERIRCFMLVGAGKSLHKNLFKGFLSKKETHRFLTCRFNLDYYRCMFYTIARTFTDDDGLSLRIAQSKIGDMDYHSPFYRDVVRFFSHNPLPINQINDLVDYINHQYGRDNDYSLKGRTLSSLTTAMKIWHREVNLVKSIGAATWEGLALADWTHAENNSTWAVTQIVTGKALAAEGSAMHHCVSSYKGQCQSGKIGIFSLTVAHNPYNPPERVLTIELDENADIRQIRGYANRTARPHEEKIVRKWASDNMLKFNKCW